jgi:hypothetical protein
MIEKHAMVISVGIRLCCCMLQTPVARGINFSRGRDNETAEHLDQLVI